MKEEEERPAGGLVKRFLENNQQKVFVYCFFSQRLQVGFIIT
jgi:hypothetical protein